MSIYDSPKVTKINMVSAPCGAGKTYATTQHIKKTIQNSNWLYVAPSIQLLNQTKMALEACGLSVDMITSDSCAGYVTGSIVQYLNNAESTGHVLLITWVSYQDIPFFPNRDNWRVIVDEVPQTDQFFEFDLSQHVAELNELLQLGETINETVSTVIPVDEGKLKRRLEKSDDLTKVLHRFLKAVLSDTKGVFVDLQSWTKIAEREKVEKGITDNRIYFLAMLNPKLFHRVTILGASIADSILYHWFSQYHGVKFLDNKKISKGLRYTKHLNMDHRLRIQYLLKDRGYSKYLANSALKDTGFRMIDGMDMAALKFIGDREFLYAVNNDYAGLLNEATNGTKMPTISHGLNEFQHYNLIYFSPSLNRSPQHLMMLRQMGIDSDIVKTATLHEVAYQALMRTALRNPDSDDIVDCIVPELATAARLASHFGEVEIKWIGDDKFEKKKPLAGSERNKKSKAAKKRQERLLPSFDDEFPLSNKETCHKKMALQEVMNLQRRPLMCALTFHNDIYQTDEEEFVVECFEPNQFVREMRSMSKDVIQGKTDNILMNPTIFYNESGEGGLRKQDNFVQSSMMMLDFDGGDLSIEDFISIFWTEAGRGNKRSFFVYNSFSRSDEAPNRFRACLMYKVPATTLEAHQAVYDSIVDRLERHGFDEESAKLDRQCRTGNQSFYVPATSAANPDWRYFKAFGCTVRDIDRYGIVPDQYLRTAVKPKDNVVYLANANGQKPVPKKPIDKWKNDICEAPSGRRKMMFDFGLAMATQFKLDAATVENHLTDVSRGDPKLEAKVSGVMDSLCKAGHWDKAA